MQHVRRRKYLLGVLPILMLLVCCEEDNTVVDNLFFKEIQPGDPIGIANLTVEIMTDDYPSEISWQLVGDSGEIANDDGIIQVSDRLYTWDVNLGSGEFTWTISDSSGDGMCCRYGDGYYNLYGDGMLLGSGGAFGASDSMILFGAEAREDIRELIFDDGVVNSATYYYSAIENGYGFGMRFDPKGAYELVSASVRIYSVGDYSWPWPNETHGLVRIIILEDSPSGPGSALYTGTTSALNGWATVIPALSGMMGSFYVIVSHDLDWSVAGDPEGFCIDGHLDYPDNMYTLEDGEWFTGDYLEKGGDYMIRATIIESEKPQILKKPYSDLTISRKTAHQAIVSAPDGYPNLPSNIIVDKSAKMDGMIP